MENLRKRLNKKAKGFTLVELLVVIAIIAILSVTAYVAMGGQTAKARNSKRMQDLGAVQNALEIYFVENYSKYPPAVGDSPTALKPDYMPELPTDPIPPNTYKYSIKPGSNDKMYHLATTLENDDGSYSPYLIGNSDTDIISGVEGAAAECMTPCTVSATGTCVPYCP